MLAIKLSRIGRKHQPSFRVIVTEKARDPWGKSLEIIGFYNPRATPHEFRVDAERVKYWIAKGAQPTDTIHNLLINAGVIDGAKRRTIYLSTKRKKKMAEKAKGAQAAAGTGVVPADAVG